MPFALFLLRNAYGIILVKVQKPATLIYLTVLETLAELSKLHWKSYINAVVME